MGPGAPHCRRLVPVLDRGDGGDLALAVWPHHLQMLAYPGFLLIAFLAMVIGGSSPGLPKGVAACASAGPVAVLLGALEFSAPAGSISGWLGSGQSDTADLLARAAEDRFPG